MSAKDSQKSSITLEAKCTDMHSCRPTKAFFAYRQQFKRKLKYHKCGDGKRRCSTSIIMRVALQIYIT